jgi:hypothetical protein
MNKEQLLKEQFNEEMFERRANGIDTETFANWKRQKVAMREFFNNWAAAQPDPESIAEARCS